MSGLNHAAAAEVMRAAWRAEHGRDPEPRELLFALAVAAAETSYGQGWVGKQAACKGSNNWGARQLTKKEQEAGVPGCDATDSHPDGETYPQQFKVYPSPEAGAREVVRLLTKERARTWAVMRDPEKSVLDFSDMLRRDRYYGGRCPEATRAHGAAVKKYGDPTDAATEACHAEAVRYHAEKFLGPHIGPIADAIGLSPPPPIVRAERASMLELGEGGGRALRVLAGAGAAGLALWAAWRIFR